MKLLGEFSDKNFDLGADAVLGGQYKLRKSGRGLIFNNNNEIAIQYSLRDNIYKLPGGGIETGESIEEGFRREISEEVGCDIKNVLPIGLVIEYRNQLKLLHLSYGFTAKVNSELRNLSLTDNETAAKFELHWYTVDEAILLIEKTTRQTYNHHFIAARELAILKAYQATH